MSGPRNALAAWSQSALRPVIPDVNTMIRAGKLPEELNAVAMKFATTGVDLGKLSSTEIVEFIRLTYALIADAIEYLAPSESEAWDAFVTSGGSPVDEGWQAVKLTGAELADMKVDQGDLEALGQIVGRTKTPNEVTAMSNFDRGLLTPEGMKAVLAADVDESVSQYEPFRGGAGSADAGDDGGTVRAAPVGARGGPGSGRRTGTRRSPSA